MHSNLNLIAPILDLRTHCSGKEVAIIGDIHGCYDEVNQLLDAIDWSPTSHVLIMTGDLIDRGPKIKETLSFARNTSSVYTLMSNHEQKLLRYLQDGHIQSSALVKTIQQCGDAFLKEPSFLKWLESLPWIVRFADNSYVIHAGIRPDRPINKQHKDHCIYITTWNPVTRKISNEGLDPWWYEYPYLYSSQRQHSASQIKIFFGHQRHDKAWVSHWACALDGGAVFGGALRAYVLNRGIVEVNAKSVYEPDKRRNT